MTVLIFTMPLCLLLGMGWFSYLIRTDKEAQDSAALIGIGTAIGLATCPVATAAAIAGYIGVGVVWEGGKLVFKGGKAAAARLKEAQERRALAEHRRRAAAAAAPPPPITLEELLAAAQQRYEETLRFLEHAGLDEVELRAARAKAKQQYLRELDGVMP